MILIPSRPKGFTLLEVLIALTILAISSLAVLRQTGQSLSQLQQLEQKNIAVYIAENRLAEITVSDTWPDSGSSSNTVTIAGQQWTVGSDISNTSDPWLKRIDVSVSQEISGGKAVSIASLTSYKGRY